MIVELLFITLCVALSIYKRDAWSGLLVLSLSVVNEIAFIIPMDDFIYHTILIINYSVFISVMQSRLIKLSLSILIFYSFILFVLAALESILHTDLIWDLIQSFARLNEYVYYSTITLIFAGLAKGSQGGHRSNSASNHLFSANHNSVNYQRIRSKFS